MHDLMIGLVFVVMVMTPCVVAMKTGVGDGAELGSRDPVEAEARDSSRIFLPG